MIFAGVGVFCAPVDWIFQYLGRPKVIITKSEYIGRARTLAQRAKEIKVRTGVVMHSHGHHCHRHCGFHQVCGLAMLADMLSLTFAAPPAGHGSPAEEAGPRWWA